MVKTRRIPLPSFVFDNMDRLREEREKKGYSRERLFRKSGVSARVIKDYEILTTLPRQKNYNKLAGALGWEKWE